MSELVLRERIDLGQGYRVRLTLNRPDRANALSGELMGTLTRIFEELAGEDACRSVVLTGAGKHFCGGADLGDMRAAAHKGEQENLKDADRLAEFFLALAALPMPVIAAVRGCSFGGAVGMLACCDAVIAEAGSIFSLSEVRLGILPAVIFPYISQRLTPGALRRLALGGQRFDAAEALRIGLVTTVVPAGKDAEAVLKEEVAAFDLGAPMAQRQIKRVHRELLGDLTRHRTAMVAAIAATRAGPEGQEGLTAFFSKRPPSWAGS